MSDQPHRVFIGYDKSEPLAYRVCETSMRACLTPTGRAVVIEPLSMPDLRTAGLYRRQFYVDDGQSYDTTDGKPFSTDFAFTRFLVPALTQWSGWALFCDSDFLWRADVRDLFALANPSRALMCVQHDHTPPEATKMRQGQVQTQYRRKNWSSLMLFNCSHPANRNLTPYMVNTQPGWWLHGLGWLDDRDIGELPIGWNWLEGHSSKSINPMAIHYTRGTPDIPGHEFMPHAKDWLAYADLAKEVA